MQIYAPPKKKGREGVWKQEVEKGKKEDTEVMKAGTKKRLVPGQALFLLQISQKSEGRNEETKEWFKSGPEQREGSKGERSKSQGPIALRWGNFQDKRKKKRTGQNSYRQAKILWTGQKSYKGTR